MRTVSEELTVFIEVSTAQFQATFKRAAEVVEAAVKYTRMWFSVISEMQRDTARTVHTAYRKKKGRRW